MALEVNGAYVYFTIPIFGGIPISQTTVSSLLLTIVLCTACFVLGRGLKKRPDGKQVLVEKGVLMMHNLVVDTMGAHNAHWTPFILTLFLSSICGSLIGMTGFLRSTTADLSTTLTWSIMVSVVIWYNSIKNNGFWGWLKGFTEPIIVMTPMNVVSEIAQPVSLAFRHFGNVAGGGIITAVIYTALSGISTLVLGLLAKTVIAPIAVTVIGIAVLIITKKKPPANKYVKLALPVIGWGMILIGIVGVLQSLGILSGVPILSLGIPAVLSLYFDLFSGFIQALVFSLLSMVYISGACPPPKEQSA